jgi:hypothetical protein
MAKGQLPKAYLRMDPNLDQHPDFEGMVMLICAANRLPRRGRWDTREQIDRILGHKRAEAFLKPRRPGKTPDIVKLQDGTFYLEGWDHWQEGDWTVGERVARLREKRKSAVTGPLHPPPVGALQEPLPALQEPLPPPLPPSEALRQQGVKATPQPGGSGAGGTLIPGRNGPARPPASSNGVIPHDPNDPVQAQIIARCKDLAAKVAALEMRCATGQDVEDVFVAVSGTPQEKTLDSMLKASPEWLAETLRSCDRFEEDLVGGGEGTEGEA